MLKRPSEYPKAFRLAWHKNLPAFPRVGKVSAQRLTDEGYLVFMEFAKEFHPLLRRVAVFGEQKKYRERNYLHSRFFVVLMLLSPPKTYVSLSECTLPERPFGQ